MAERKNIRVLPGFLCKKLAPRVEVWYTAPAMAPTCVDQLPDDLALLKQMVVERELALVGRQLQIERIEREAAAALAKRDAAVAEREARIEQIRREAAEQIEA